MRKSGTFVGEPPTAASAVEDIAQFVVEAAVRSQGSGVSRG